MRHPDNQDRLCPGIGIVFGFSVSVCHRLSFKLGRVSADAMGKQRCSILVHGVSHIAHFQAPLECGAVQVLLHGTAPF